MFRKIFFTFILITILFSSNQSLAATLEILPKKYNDFLQFFYNRYSRHFDKIGLKYAVPDYGVKKFSSPQYGREIISLTNYYKFRALQNDTSAIKILKENTLKALTEEASRPNISLSFNDAEALFLITRILEQLPELFSEDEKGYLQKILNEKISGGIEAQDTENRAIVAATHWQYLNNYLFANNLISKDEKEENDGRIKNKIDVAIKNSISKNGWYREGKIFVPHYHAVSAFMIMVYGQLTNKKSYSDLAGKMYFNLKKISFKNGQVEAQIGHRPVGLGAQFYLMVGLLGKMSNDPDYLVYLNYVFGNKFFSDKKYPNRLEYHRTTSKYSPNYHDDYAFADVAELSLILPDLNLEIKKYVAFKKPILESDDKEMKISNQGNKITILDRQQKQKILLQQKNNWITINKRPSP